MNPQDCAWCELVCRSIHCPMMPITSATVLAIAALAPLSSAFQLGVQRPALRMPHISMQINQDGKAIDLNDETVFPKNAEGKVLITLASLDERALFDLEGALAERNRERILEGKPKYENIQEMIDAYIEFEGPGTKENLTPQECEDATIRYLSRKALMMEGGAEWNDPRKDCRSSP